MSDFRSRSAPAVVYPVGRSRALGMALVALHLLAAAALVAWAAAGAGPSFTSAAAAGGLWLAAVAGSVHFWRGQFEGSLQWDGQAWALVAQARGVDTQVPCGAPEVFLDLQSHLWVRVSPDKRRALWLWLARQARPERWMDMRRAVYSRARPGTDADATAAAGSRGA